MTYRLLSPPPTGARPLVLPQHGSGEGTGRHNLRPHAALRGAASGSSARPQYTSTQALRFRRRRRRPRRSRYLSVRSGRSVPGVSSRKAAARKVRSPLGQEQKRRRALYVAVAFVLVGNQPAADGSRPCSSCCNSGRTASAASARADGHTSLPTRSSAMHRAWAVTRGGRAGALPPWTANGD